MARVTTRHRGKVRRPHGSFQPRPENAVIGKRLTDARIAAGYPTAADAARALGMRVTTYQHHENGRRLLDHKQAQVYAEAFGTTAGHLMFGSELLSETCVAIVAHAVEQGMIVQVDATETVMVPEGIGNIGTLKAFKIMSEDLWPVFQSGDVAFYDPADLRKPVHNDVVVGQNCVVMTPLGTLMVRFVRSWSDGRATLMAYNQREDETMRILAAAPVRIVIKSIQVRAGGCPAKSAERELEPID